MIDDRAERALRTALEARAEAYAPGLIDVPPATRLRRWPAIAAAAVLVLGAVLGAVVGAVLVAVAGQHRHVLAPSDSLPSGWRWESHADVMVGVPDSWRYAAAPASDWCAVPKPSEPPQGYVDTRTSGVVLDILCGQTPPIALTAPHLTFDDDVVSAEIPPPPGWMRQSRTLGGTRLVVTVQSDRRALADRILATARVVTTDQNGCAVTSPVQASHRTRPADAFDIATVTRVDSISVCQYDVGRPARAGLVASRSLTGPAARAELSALRSAAVGGGPDRLRHCQADWGPTVIVLRLTTRSTVRELYASYSGDCGNGVDDGTHLRQLTPEDCRPLFSARIGFDEGIKRVFDRCA